jgi:branched-chain amino acid transport system ATP-binding protein
MPDPILRVRGLQKSFGAITVSDTIDLDLFAGEIHAVIGPNGAGKSSLVKQLCGDIKPDDGAIWFAGRDLAGTGPSERARLGMARTFQVSSVMGEFTALQNVMLSIQGAEHASFRLFRPASSFSTRTEAARLALDHLGLGGRMDIPASNLSHGERRRLELAMAMSMKPGIFLLDEPMAGLGPEGSLALTAILTDLKAQAPILLVEHDMDAVFTLADRISVLVNGRVIATGTVGEIRANREVQAAYLGDAA